ncbi:DUF4007 family protein [Candidatus Poriferisocius sp.]|uniref:DUF4007 family protein n=1 Tax=Candidatus Poriferisocius sp. TaxID=3101276 RepID=UPI003B017838
MRLVDAAMDAFARHETFHPRYGWFRKAYIHTARDPHVFVRDDAPVVIGVGKNMVRAIRFWGLAAKLIVEDPKPPNRRAQGCVPTRIGHALFGESGWDPYMEDPGTLWLLHWLLFAPQSRLPVWWLAFNEFNAVEFTDDQLEAAILTQMSAVSDWASPHESSLKKDISALMRTYAPAQKSGRVGIDDILDCPLRELNLIGDSAGADGHRFALGAKPTLPSEIATYAVLDWLARPNTHSRTATLSRLAYEPGSPGRVFKLTEAELLAALEPSIEYADELDLVMPTGAVQLTWSEAPSVIAPDILNSYYGSAQQDVCAGFDGDEPVSDEILDDLGFGREPGDEIRRLHQIAAKPRRVA